MRLTRGSAGTGRGGRVGAASRIAARVVPAAMSRAVDPATRDPGAAFRRQFFEPAETMTALAGGGGEIFVDALAVGAQRRDDRRIVQGATIAGAAALRA